MLLRPISENSSTGKIKTIYADIKESLSLSFVPLPFQYMANYESYFIEVWDHIKLNLKSREFTEAVKGCQFFTSSALEVIYTPSEKIKNYLKKENLDKKEELYKTAFSLSQANAMLLVITLAVREGLKGLVYDVPAATPRLSNEDLVKDISGLSSGGIKISSAEDRFLLPLLGDSTSFTEYQSFFTLLKGDMDKLFETEAYLKTRVEMEKISISFIKKLPSPISYSYWEIARLIGEEANFHELVYLIRTFFPTQFPSLLITSVAMQQVVSTD